MKNNIKGEASAQHNCSQGSSQVQELCDCGEESCNFCAAQEHAKKKSQVQKGGYKLHCWTDDFSMEKEMTRDLGKAGFEAKNDTNRRHCKIFYKKKPKSQELTQDEIRQKLGTLKKRTAAEMCFLTSIAYWAQETRWARAAGLELVAAEFRGVRDGWVMAYKTAKFCNLFKKTEN